MEGQQVEQPLHECSLCHNPPDENMSTCIQCHKTFHQNCVNVVDDSLFKCLSCSSIRPNSPTLSVTSRRSNRSRQSQSQKIDLRLQKLEEERKLNQEYLNKKYQLLEEAEALSDASSEESQTVHNWLASTNSVSQQQILSKDVSTNSNLQASRLPHHIAQNSFNISAPVSNQPPTTRSGSTIALQNGSTFVPPTVINAAINSSLPVFTAPNCTANISTFSGFSRMQPSRPSVTINQPGGILTSSSSSNNNNTQNLFYSFPQEFISHQPITSASIFDTHRPISSTAYPPVHFPPVHSLSQTNVNSRQSLPKELPVFSGQPEEWPIFFSTYEWSTTACAFTDTENLIRLQKALKGEALRSVQHMLIHPSNVPGVIEILRMLYGQPEKIINSIKNRIHLSPKVDENNLKTLTSLAIEVRSLISTITASNLSDEINNSSLLFELIQKLPPSYQMQWATQKMQLINQNKKPNLFEFDKWIFNLGITASSINS